MAGDADIQRIARLTPLVGVLARIEALVAPVTPRAAALASAQGQVLAEDVSAPADLPAQAIALRDGYAVRAEDIADAGPYSPMPFGVKIPAVSAAKTCFEAVVTEIFENDETRFCHFSISKKRLKNDSESKNSIPPKLLFLSNFSANRCQSSASLLAS